MSKSNSKTWKAWAIRKVRNGRVKFHGHWYYPEETYQAYSGELDGLWLAFHSYEIYDDDDKCHFYPRLHIWGTLEYFNMRTEEEIDAYNIFSEPHVDEDGRDRWDSWYPNRTDIISIINGAVDNQMKRHLTEQVRNALLPDIDWREQFDIIGSHFDGQPIIEGLQS